MKLLSEGRASQIFDLGDGRVLRRFKRGGEPRREAAFMQLARANGFPAPAVLEVRSNGLILEKVDGPTVHEALTAQPESAVAEAAAELARLHQQLHAIATPDGRALLHGDLHWKNVIRAPGGPVVVDWANAGGGDPALDTALTWVILATSSGPRGRVLASLFAQVAEVHSARQEALRRRFADAGLGDVEREAVARLLGRSVAEARF